MARHPDTSWNSPARLGIGRALLRASGQPLTAAGLAHGTLRDVSNTKRTADAMVRDGLLALREPPPRADAVSPRAGRPAQSAYALAEGAQAKLEHALVAATAPGALRSGQQLVFAEATADQISDVYHVLAETPTIAQATWSAVCDGERQEVAIAFEGEDSAAMAIDLMAVLAAAEVRCRRMSIAQVTAIPELLRRVDATTRAAQRAQLRRQTRRIA